jgi:hypothetical protein
MRDAEQCALDFGLESLGRTEFFSIVKALLYSVSAYSFRVFMGFSTENCIEYFA